MVTRRTTSLAVAALLALGGCCGAESSVAPTTSSTPLPPPSCRTGEGTRSCLTDVAALIERESRLQADGERVTHEDVLAVLGAVVERFIEHAGWWSYSLDTPLGDADVEAVSTEPIKTTWSLDSFKGSLWACFSNGSVQVKLSACD